eukprot:5696986-Prorocentrum_lima.AAC.1
MSGAVGRGANASSLASPFIALDGGVVVDSVTSPGFGFIMILWPIMFVEGDSRICVDLFLSSTFV